MHQSADSLYYIISGINPEMLSKSPRIRNPEMAYKSPGIMGVVATKSKFSTDLGVGLVL